VIPIYFLNSTTIGDKTYAFTDHTTLHMPAEFKLPREAYGGRIHWLGKVKDSDLLLVIEQVRGDTYRVIDLCVESLAHVPIEVLRRMADMRKIPYLTKDDGEKKATTYKELQKLLK
jgi:hypothetical protein